MSKQFDIERRQVESEKKTLKHQMMQLQERQCIPMSQICAFWAVKRIECRTKDPLLFCLIAEHMVFLFILLGWMSSQSLCTLVDKSFDADGRS